MEEEEGKIWRCMKKGRIINDLEGMPCYFAALLSTALQELRACLIC